MNRSVLFGWMFNKERLFEMINSWGELLFVSLVLFIIKIL
jgi:hypothetical protein